MRSSVRRSRVLARRSKTSAPRSTRRRRHRAATAPIRRARPARRVAIAPRPVPIHRRRPSTSRDRHRGSSDRNDRSRYPSSLRLRPRSSTIPNRRYRPSGRRYTGASHASDWQGPDLAPFPMSLPTAVRFQCGAELGRDSAAGLRWRGTAFLPHLWRGRFPLHLRPAGLAVHLSPLRLCRGRGHQSSSAHEEENRKRRAPSARIEARAR